MASFTPSPITTPASGLGAGAFAGSGAPAGAGAGSGYSGMRSLSDTMSSTDSGTTYSSYPDTPTPVALDIQGQGILPSDLKKSLFDEIDSSNMLKMSQAVESLLSADDRDSQKAYLIKLGEYAEKIKHNQDDPRCVRNQYGVISDAKGLSREDRYKPHGIPFVGLSNIGYLLKLSLCDKDLFDWFDKNKSEFKRLKIVLNSLDKLERYNGFRHILNLGEYASDILHSNIINRELQKCNDLKELDMANSVHRYAIARIFCVLGEAGKSFSRAFRESTPELKEAFNSIGKVRDQCKLPNLLPGKQEKMEDARLFLVEHQNTFIKFFGSVQTHLLNAFEVDYGPLLNQEGILEGFFHDGENERVKGISSGLQMLLLRSKGRRGDTKEAKPAATLSLPSQKTDEQIKADILKQVASYQKRIERYEKSLKSLGLESGPLPKCINSEEQLKLSGFKKLKKIELAFQKTQTLEKSLDDTRAVYEANKEKFGFPDFEEAIVSGWSLMGDKSSSVPATVGRAPATPQSGQQKKLGNSVKRLDMFSRYMSQMIDCLDQIKEGKHELSEHFSQYARHQILAFLGQICIELKSLSLTVLGEKLCPIFIDRMNELIRMRNLGVMHNLPAFDAARIDVVVDGVKHISAKVDSLKRLAKFKKSGSDVNELKADEVTNIAESYFELGMYPQVADLLEARDLGIFEEADEKELLRQYVLLIRVYGITSQNQKIIDAEIVGVENPWDSIDLQYLMACLMVKYSNFGGAHYVCEEIIAKGDLVDPKILISTFSLLGAVFSGLARSEKLTEADLYNARQYYLKFLNKYKKQPYFYGKLLFLYSLFLHASGAEDIAESDEKLKQACEVFEAHQAEFIINEFAHEYFQLLDVVKLYKAGITTHISEEHYSRDLSDKISTKLLIDLGPAAMRYINIKLKCLVHIGANEEAASFYQVIRYNKLWLRKMDIFSLAEFDLTYLEMALSQKLIDDCDYQRKLEFTYCALKKEKITKNGMFYLRMKAQSLLMEFYLSKNMFDMAFSHLTDICNIVNLTPLMRVPELFRSIECMYLILNRHAEELKRRDIKPDKCKDQLKHVYAEIFTSEMAIEMKPEFRRLLLMLALNERSDVYAEYIRLFHKYDLSGLVKLNRFLWVNAKARALIMEYSEILLSENSIEAICEIAPFLYVAKVSDLKFRDFKWEFLKDIINGMDVFLSSKLNEKLPELEINLANFLTRVIQRLETFKNGNKAQTQIWCDSVNFLNQLIPVVKCVLHSEGVSKTAARKLKKFLMAYDKTCNDTVTSSFAGIMAGATASGRSTTDVPAEMHK